MIIYFLPSLFFLFVFLFSVSIGLHRKSVGTSYNPFLAKWLSDTQANSQKPLRQARNRWPPL